MFFPAIPATHEIALIDAVQLPTDVVLGGGVGLIPINYPPAQYNGAAITAVQVTPPSFLNIVPEVINQVASKRNAVLAGAAIQAIVAIPPVVVGLGGALPASQLPPDNILQPLLAQSQWGNAFIGLVQDIRTPIQITVDSINSIFSWDDGVINDMACRDSYVQAIMDLLQLPSGISLFRDIIIAHHCLPHLPKVRFASRNTESRISLSKDERIELSEINLQWQGDRHVGGELVCIATDSSLQAPAGNYPGKGRRVDFVNVEVPPSVVFAHELGHYLYYLEAYKNTMDLQASIIAEAIESTPRGRVACKNAIGSINGGVKHDYPYVEYKKILEGIVTHPPHTAAEQAFVELWDHETSEIVNILPAANILRNGGSRYSDGIIIGEAVLAPNCRIRKQISFTKKNRYGVSERVDFNNLAAGGVVSASFICLGHASSKKFWSILNRLIIVAAGNAAIGAAIVAAVGGTTANPAVIAAAGVGGGAAANAASIAMRDFKDLVQRLLDKITVAGNSLSAANNNLPVF
jgi:hypothetical protein